MSNGKQIVLAKHIQKGIEKYKGKSNPTIQNHLDNISWNYEVFEFEDKRLLLVYHTKLFAILYDSKEILFKDLDDFASQNIS